MTEPERLSEAEVAELERLEKAATPGPWGTTWKDRPDLGGHVFGPDRRRQIAGCRGASGYPLEEHDANAVYIAAARNAMPRLLAERAALREALDDSNRMAASMFVSIEHAPCRCSVSVQPPHALKCHRCRALEEFNRHRAASIEHEARALLAGRKEDA